MISLYESVLTTDDLFLHMLRDATHRHRHDIQGEGEADWPVLSQVLLFALLEDWNDIGFPPLLRHFGCSP